MILNETDPNLIKNVNHNDVSQILQKELYVFMHYWYSYVMFNFQMCNIWGYGVGLARTDSYIMRDRLDMSLGAYSLTDIYI